MLRHIVMFAFQNFFKAAHGFGQRHKFAGHTGEGLRHMQGLGEEALYLARTANGQLIFLRKFIHAQNGDHIL